MTFINQLQDILTTRKGMARLPFILSQAFLELVKEVAPHLLQPDKPTIEVIPSVIENASGQTEVLKETAPKLSLPEMMAKIAPPATKLRIRARTK